MEKSDIIFLNEPQNVSMGDDWYEYARLNHFWFSWRFLFLKRYLSKIITPNSKLMEIGCGNSCFREQVESSFNVPIDGCDLNLFALEKGNKGKGKFYIYDVFTKDLELKNKYDVIFLLDVIEHLENDKEFIDACIEMLKVGGYLVINVPYSQLLFSKYDKAVGHIRRYSKNDLKKIMTSLNFDVHHLSTWGFFLLPISILRTMIISLISNRENIIKNGIQPPSNFVNNCFHLLKRLELLFPFSFPIGTSVVCIAKKEATEEANEEK